MKPWRSKDRRAHSRLINEVDAQLKKLQLQMLAVQIAADRLLEDDERDQKHA